MTRNRKKVPDAVLTSLLVKTRRRCCLCVYLKNDRGQKRIQVAHINHRPSENDEENLVPLCLDHHDEYDSVTSQSKGLTASELRFYKQKLIDELSELPTESIEHKAIERETPDITGSYLYQYGVLFSEVSRIIYRCDPVSLNFEFNPDEYDPEVHDLLKRLLSGAPLTGSLCKGVFVEWFGEDLAASYTKYDELADEITLAWTRFQQSNAMFVNDD